MCRSHHLDVTLDHESEWDTGGGDSLQNVCLPGTEPESLSPAPQGGTQLESQHLEVEARRSKVQLPQTRNDFAVGSILQLR